MTSTTPTPIRIRLPLRPRQIAQRDEHDPEPSQKIPGKRKATHSEEVSQNRPTHTRTQWYLHKSKKSQLHKHEIHLPTMSISRYQCMSTHLEEMKGPGCRANSGVIESLQDTSDRDYLPPRYSLL